MFTLAAVCKLQYTFVRVRVCETTHSQVEREREPSLVTLKETGTFVPVSSETCGSESPSEACDLEDEESVEGKRGGGGGGREKAKQAKNAKMAS